MFYHKDKEDQLIFAWESALSVMATTNAISKVELLGPATWFNGKKWIIPSSIKSTFEENNTLGFQSL